VSQVRTSGLRRRALGLVLTCGLLAGGTTFAKSSTTADLDGAPDQAAADVLHVARNQVGDPYVWGGNGPDGWDCSGLTSLWRTVGGAEDMPRVSRDQQAWAVPIPQEQALRGDLVFFGHPVTHVGIVSGGGYMIDAGASKSAVVERRIWSSGVVRYGRVPRPGMPRVTPWTPPPLPSPVPAAPVADTPAAAAQGATPVRVAGQPTAKPTSKPTGRPTGKPSSRPTSKAGAKATGKPTSKPTGKPTSKPTGKPGAKPTSKPTARPTSSRNSSPRTKPTSTLTPLQGLPGTQKAPSSTVARRAAANAKATAGRPVGPKAWNDVSLVATAWRHAGGGTLPADRAALLARTTPVALSDARVGDLVVYSAPDRPHLAVYLGHGYMVSASATHGRVMVRRVYDAPSVRLARLR
jgi:cell wall-associated NlpC family hydrolase